MSLFNPSPAPPAAIECEQAVIGSVLMNGDRYWAATEAGLRASHFADALHQRIWLAIADQVKEGMKPSALGLTRRFADDPDMQRMGGPKYLSGLAVASAGVVSPVTDYARTIIDWSNRRTIIDLGSQLTQWGRDAEAETSEMLDRAEAVLSECRLGNSRTGPQPMTAIVSETLESIERAHKRGKVEGVETGLRAIDRSLGGLADTDLIILAGRPGMGKSALAGTIAFNVAQLHPVALFSLEMSAGQFATRILSGLSGVDGKRIRRGEFGADEARRIHEAGEKAGPVPLYIDDTAQIKPMDVRARLKRLARSTPPKLIVVDYVQLMRADESRRDGSRVLEIGDITGSLKAIAKEFRCPVLALSQLSRAVEQRDDKRPVLSDLRDSGAIEQDADQVWFLYRDEYYARREEPPVGASPERYSKWQDRMQAGQGVADLIVAKNRHGPDDLLRLAFDGRFGRFGNLEG